LKVYRGTLIYRGPSEEVDFEVLEPTGLVAEYVVSDVYLVSEDPNLVKALASSRSFLVALDSVLDSMRYRIELLFAGAVFDPQKLRDLGVENILLAPLEDVIEGRIRSTKKEEPEVLWFLEAVDVLFSNLRYTARSNLGVAIYVGRDLRAGVYPAVRLEDGIGLVSSIRFQKDALRKVVDRALEDFLSALTTRIIPELTKVELRKALTGRFVEQHAKHAEEALEKARSGADLPERTLPGEVKSTIREGYKLEEQGRNLAYRLTTVDQYELYDLLDEVSSWASEVEDISGSLINLIYQYVPMRDLAQNLADIAESLADLFKAIRKDAEVGVVSNLTLELLRDIDGKFRSRLGQRVMWGEGSSWAFVVNNATAALHRLLDAVSGILGHRAVILSSNPNAERWARAFLTVVRMLEEGVVYVSDEDLEPTSIVVKDDEVLMRLGSSPGHAARIDLRGGTLHYYDADEDVVEVMLELIKRFVPVVEHSYNGEELVIRFTPTPDNVEKLCAVMPLAISMDYRIEDLRDEVEEGVAAYVEELAESKKTDALLRLCGYEESAEELRERVMHRLQEYLRLQSKEEDYTIPVRLEERYYLGVLEEAIRRSLAQIQAQTSEKHTPRAIPQTV